MRAFRSKEGHDEAQHATEGVDWFLLFLEILEERDRNGRMYIFLSNKRMREFVFL